MKPILKWPGGKRQLLKEINEYLPHNFNTYYEPFFGGGAVFLHIMPDNAKINDINTDLINTYIQVKENPSKLIELLKEHKNNHCEDYYYKIRELDRNDNYINMDCIEKAARFIYLNKTCYNGLQRVNSKGQFNTPIGKYKKPLICDEVSINELSKYLNNKKVEIKNEDFELFLKNVEKDDFVYLDPPYDPVSKTSNFTNYNKDGFSKNEQIRLKKICDELHKKGAKFMLSNSDTNFINELYKDYKIIKVKAKRSINSNGDKRGIVYEVIVINY